jgi:predicted secreted protein
MKPWLFWFACGVILLAALCAWGQETRIVRLGDTFAVALESTPGSGYAWHLAKGEPMRTVRAVGTPGLFLPVAKAGAPATQIFKFRAAELGPARLEFHYRRGTGPSVKTYIVSVTVKE